MTTEKNLVPVHTMVGCVASGQFYAFGWGGGLGPDGIRTDPRDTEEQARAELRHRLAAAGRRPAVPADYPLPITGTD